MLDSDEGLVVTEAEHPTGWGSEGLRQRHQRLEDLADVGLALCPGIIALPHARSRLRLGDPRRVALFARRFAPARGVTLDAGSRLLWEDGRLVEAVESARLMQRGALRPVKPS